MVAGDNEYVHCHSWDVRLNHLPYLDSVYCTIVERMYGSSSGLAASAASSSKCSQESVLDYFQEHVRAVNLASTNH